MPKTWKDRFDERELKEIEFCITFAKAKHLSNRITTVRTIIAKMADLLDMAETAAHVEKAIKNLTTAEHTKEAKKDKEDFEKIFEINPLSDGRSGKPIPYRLWKRHPDGNLYEVHANDVKAITEDPDVTVYYGRLEAMGVSQMRGLTKKDKEDFERVLTGPLEKDAEEPPVTNEDTIMVSWDNEELPALEPIPTTVHGFGRLIYIKDKE